MTGLRCHLLIGPPASGKTTTAALLAPLLHAEVFSTDRIREELYGDAAIQGHWPEVEAKLHESIRQAIAAGQSVLIDATHAQRPWRLALTQRLELPAPVEWIGWWLRTPLAVCLAWNQQRPRSVPELVIRQFQAALSTGEFLPDRREGFATLVDLDPSRGDQAEQLEVALAQLNRRIAAARNRDSAKELHGYSRLIDLERLLYLLQLLCRFPGLCASEVETEAELTAICNPPPQGSMAQRAAGLLSALRGSCYGDVEALERDLLWLEQQGFLSPEPTRAAIEPPPVSPGVVASQRGGWPPMADRGVFVRVLTLLRHLMHHPFSHQKGVELADHLIAELHGIYMPGEASTLRKDVEWVLTPYGFRTRNDNTRHGYGLGTAVLSEARLREVHQVVRQAAARLGDPTAQDLLAELDERLRWGGVLRKDTLPVRVFANRSIVHPDMVRRDSLAVPQQAERLEAAITAGQRVVLERFSDAANHGEEPKEPIHVWPLQLLFHNIGWYLAYEKDAVGRDHGLICTERLDRLGLRQVDKGFIRPLEARRAGVDRLTRLMERCGGIYFGEDAELQALLAAANLKDCRHLLVTVRFRCTLSVYRFLREGLQRYPLEQMRLSKPLPGDRWRPPAQAPLVLEPVPDSTHPFPVEIDLPPWTVARDVDFRRWLFGYGAGVLIEKPSPLKDEMLDKLKRCLDLYEPSRHSPK